MVFGDERGGIWRGGEGGRFDCHYHECNEYWMIYKGKGKVMTEGQGVLREAGGYRLHEGGRRA